MQTGIVAHNKVVHWKSKLSSRKFWTAVASFVSMLIVALHGEKETATQVAALIMAGASVVAFIIGEGMADAAGAKAIAEQDWPEHEEPPEEENG